tara:strand:- start:5149 stop:5721 length:573 start_codon:yes stop_codon:yes gene_type:complete
MMPVSAPMPDEHQNEIRLMGLILVQALSIGLAVGIFDAEFWIVLGTPAMNGVTYSMAAFAVQGLAYYIFKMFFQQGMDEKARSASMERERRIRYRSMETTFDRRRQDMEMRMQESQLESELQWMEHNPGKTPPWVEARMYGGGSGTLDFAPQIPLHASDKKEQPLSLGLDFGDGEEKTPRSSDGKFKKKE